MRFAPLFAATALAIAAPAYAQDSAPSIGDVLANPDRADEAVRDQYRHPAETLAFFQVEPTMTVVEYSPGGGWYTRVLAPYVSPNGTYLAINRDSGTVNWPNRAAEARGKGWVETFSNALRDEYDTFGDDEVIAFETDEVPEDIAGTVDRVLIFRSMHGMRNNAIVDTELRAIRGMLADDGMVGVVQHRAPEDATYADSRGSRGYVRQSDIVSLFELNGFELVDSSEINANPNDPADWEGGVWTLPPILRYGAEDRARYQAIGESDRMTLLFRKRD